jgi:hypothetical protein
MKRPEERGLVLGFGQLQETAIMEAVKVLGCTVRRHL